MQIRIGQGVPYSTIGSVLNFIGPFSKEEVFKKVTVFEHWSAEKTWKKEDYDISDDVCMGVVMHAESRGDVVMTV